MQTQLARLETAFADGGFPCVLTLSGWVDVWDKIQAIESAEECVRIIGTPRELIESPLVRARNGGSVCPFRLTFTVIASTPELAEAKAREWVASVFKAKGGRLGRPLSTPFSYQGIRFISLRPSGDVWNMAAEPAPVVGNAGNYWSLSNELDVVFLEE